MASHFLLCGLCVLCGASVSPLWKTGTMYNPQTKKKRIFIEECTQCPFSTEGTQRHHRGHRGHRGENAMPFSREVTEAPHFFADGAECPTGAGVLTTDQYKAWVGGVVMTCLFLGGLDKELFLNG